MFVVIDMSEDRKRIFEKFRKHEIELKRYDVKGCAPFFVAKCHRNYTDFNELKQIVSRYGVALFSKEEHLSGELVYLQFTPEVLPLKMLVKTVGEYFSFNKVMCNKTITIVDPKARACNELKLVAQKVRYVRVITSRFDRYRFIADEIFESYGISIDLCEKISTSYGSDIIVTLDDTPFADFDYGTVICFKKHTNNKNVVMLDQSDLCYDKFDCNAYGIDKFTFISALYETCGYHLPQIPVFNDKDKLKCVL